MGRIAAALRDRVTVLRYMYISCLVRITLSCNFASHVGPLRKETRGVCTLKIRSRILKSSGILVRPFVCVVRLICQIYYRHGRFFQSSGQEYETETDKKTC